MLNKSDDLMAQIICNFDIVPYNVKLYNETPVLIFMS